jgi:hypothetical protein
MSGRADRLNRVVLTLLGLLLLLVGVAGLLPGSGLLGDDVASRQVLPSDAGSFVSRNGVWLWPVVALVAVLLSLLALRGLLLQLRTDRVDHLDLTRLRRKGETHVDTGAVTTALVGAVEQCPGVDSASSRLVRLRGTERLLLHVRLADRADIADTRQQLTDGPVRELLQVLGETCPPLTVELEPSTKGSSRAVV